MLKELRISNIVLIETATLQFAPGFNVLSGETGAGKSAIMNALALIAGGRCDASIIRRGADKGSVEALFDIELLPHLAPLLEDAGIDHEAGTELLIKRELSTKGKSRAFINNQLAQPVLLRKLAESLFEIIGQHANQKLLSLEHHRHVLDMFGELEEARSAFAACWVEEKEVQQQLEQLIESETQREKEIETCRKTIEELQEAQVKADEEEQLFSDYSRLSNAGDLLARAAEINRALSGDKSNLLAQLNRQKTGFEQLLQMAPELSETATAFDSALLELLEVSHVMRRFESHIEYNPAKAAELNKRLELINHLKRKYSLGAEEFDAYLEATKQKLHFLENAGTHIEDLKTKLQALSAKTTELSHILTIKRQTAALTFQKLMEAQLHSLNMPKAQFIVEIAPQKRSSSGDDKVEFFLIPNLGENRVAVKECASGGELSRILLAIQTLLAGKEKIPCLIFDEIDGNIGGETAVIIGQKLQEIGKCHQILCITHFHQVAIQAQHHLRVHKKEIEGRTVSLVDLLDHSNRHNELARMQGNTSPS